MLLPKINLHLFGEEGESGSPAVSTGEASNISGDTSAPTQDVEMPSFLPEKAKGAFNKAFSKAAQPVQQQPTEAQTSAESKPAHIPFADLIKSDEYKDEHKAYMDKTIADRLKKYKGIEERSNKMQETLGMVARKYGLNADDEGFLDAVAKKVSEDDSYLEQYAMDHDISVEEARRNISTEEKLQRLERQERQRAEQAEVDSRVQRLQSNAAKTKAMYPEFDLEREMQNPQFQRLCIATNEDTTGAYLALHANEIINGRVVAQTQANASAIAQSVAANRSRPIENGLSSQASAVTQINFKNMSRQQLKEYAEANMRR